MLGVHTDTQGPYTLVTLPVAVIKLTLVVSAYDLNFLTFHFDVILNPALSGLTTKFTRIPTSFLGMGAICDVIHENVV